VTSEEIRGLRERVFQCSYQPDEPSIYGKMGAAQEYARALEAQLAREAERAYRAGFIDGAGGTPQGHGSDFGDGGYDRLIANADKYAARYAARASLRATPPEGFFEAFTSRLCTICGGRRDWALDGQLQAVCYRCGNPASSPDVSG
jgi:hypothetical protein